MNQINNLKPFTGKDDPRRQNGRVRGSKNKKTLVRDILDSEIDPTLPFNGSLSRALVKSKTYREAIVMAMVIKAMDGDVRAATWLSDRYQETPDPDSFFMRPELIFNVVPGREEKSAAKLE